MAPHTIDLVIEKGTGEHRGDRWLYMAGTDNDVCCIPEETQGGAEAWAKLFIAAKLLVEALLLDLGEHGHTPDCSQRPTAGGSLTCSSPVCRQKREALAKAGVQLP